MADNHISDNAERVNPYDGDNRHKTQQVEAMFDSIAPAYDFMNSAMSFGLHRRWLRKALRAVAPSSSFSPASPASFPKEATFGLDSAPNEVRSSAPTVTTGSLSILDVATGTADVAIALARKFPEARIAGIDLSEGMLAVGRRKVAKAGLSDRITLTQADCLHLPFDDNSFDAVTVAYGVRNFERLLDGYREMTRVLRPGGRLVVIELSTPKSKLVKPFYKFYTRCIIPVVGRLVSKDVRAYSYLPESIAAVAQGSHMTALMQQAGLTSATHRPLTLGVCTIYTATKPTPI